MSSQLKFALYEEELLNPLRGHTLSEHENYVASLLLTASSSRPIGIDEIIETARERDIKLSVRTVKSIVRTLRKDHTFPILSSKKPPTGYWWCQSLEEMQAFIESFRAQAFDELHTLSKIVKHNYPALQGQLKFEEAS